MESIEFDLSADLDDIILDKSIGEFLNNKDLKTAIEDVGVGCNDEYERQLIEQKKKREEYLQYKEQRRRESKEERLRSVLMEKRELEELMKCEEPYDENQRVIQRPKRQRPKPFERLNTNVNINRKAPNERPNKKQTLKCNVDSEPMTVNKRFKPDSVDTSNKNFGLTTVLIRNLSPETNEFTISSLGERVGKVLGVCVALEEGVRKAMVRFDSPVDSLLFQRKYNNYKLDSTFIKTNLIS